MKIFGAGLAGLLAAQHFQRATIYEKESEPKMHSALLRFRSDVVGRFTGMEFKKVLVRKGIWYNGGFVEPNIRIANMYANKVIDGLADRSIWHIEPVARFIAPDHFIPELLERTALRIKWAAPVGATTVLDNDSPAISTLPLGLMHQWVIGDGDHYKEIGFHYRRIYTRVFRITNSDVYQTVYFPHVPHHIYRASITGNRLIVEGMHEIGNVEMDVVRKALYINNRMLIEEVNESRPYGKIAPINDQWRKQFLYELTHRHQIYSLGRYGTWRNILLDDVFKDINVLKKLMGQKSEYDKVKSSI